MAGHKRTDPEPNETVSLRVLDETAAGMRIHADPPGSTMDNWSGLYNQSEKKPPGDEHSGQFCMIRTVDGRNLSMRIFRTYGTKNWTCVSVHGGIEEDVAIEWVAPIRVIITR